MKWLQRSGFLCGTIGHSALPISGGLLIQPVQEQKCRQNVDVASSTQQEQNEQQRARCNHAGRDSEVWRDASDRPTSCVGREALSLVRYHKYGSSLYFTVRP